MLAGGSYMFYVYEWYVLDTNEIFYVGKGCRNRYKVRKHNKLFNQFIKQYNCESRIVKTFENEKDAFSYEYDRIKELKKIGQCCCNIYDGGLGGTVSWWTDEKKAYFSEHNAMKNDLQRKRMSEKNPMKNPTIAAKVGLAHRKRPIINGTLYKDVFEASEKEKVCLDTIYNWCNRGYDTKGNPCRYENEPQPEYFFKKPGEKPVVIGDQIFRSVSIAAQHFNSYPEKIIRAIKNNKTVFGLTCKYGNQQPSHTNTENSSVEGSTTNE